MQPTHDDLDIDESITDYSELSPLEIRKKLVWWWFHIFRQNPDFESYCEAKRTSDVATCTELEEKFELIAELYEDWEDIHILPNMQDEKSEDWESWLASKEHMFFLVAIEPPKTPVHAVEAPNLVVSIPAGLTKKQLEILFEDLLGSRPDILGTGPKYSIANVKGESPRDTLLRLEKANLVHGLLSGDGEFKFSHAEIAALVLKVPTLQKSGFHWYPSNGTGGQKERIGNGSFKLKDVDNQKRTVVNLGKFYLACIDSTIHGIFPR